jgi:hypothetical protein
VLATGAGSLLSLFAPGNGSNPAAALSALGGSIFLILVAGLLVAYALFSAIMNYARNYKFGDAFEFKTILKKAFTGDYAVIWLLLVFGGGIAGSILSFIPWVGSAFANFVASVFGFSALGEIYAKL